jgi:hypothetical protein
MRLMAEQQTKSTDMMMTMMKQMINNNTQQLAIQQAEGNRKREVHGCKIYMYVHVSWEHEASLTDSTVQ